VVSCRSAVDPQRRAQSNKKHAFGGSGLNLLRAPGTEDGVLCLQESDLAQQDGLRHVKEENEKRVLAGFGHRKRAKKMANQAVFGYENLHPTKNGIYRGGAGAEQGFCTPLKTTGRGGAAADGNRGRKTLWLLT